MIHDDDDLDRALAALPLEEPPPGFRARVLAATVAAPQRLPVPARGLELWAVGSLAALVVWLCWLVVADAEAGRRAGGAIAHLFDGVPLGSTQLWMWAAVGAATALWLSLLTVPAPRRVASRR